MIKISENEVFDIVFNHNLSINLLKENQLNVSFVNWLFPYLNDEFLEEVVQNQEDYSEFIQEYIKPIMGWGILLDNFEYISMKITDAGMIHLIGEGATLIGRDSRYDTKLEIKQNIFNHLKRLDIFCKYQKKLNNSKYELYKELKIEPTFYRFKRKVPIINNFY